MCDIEPHPSLPASQSLCHVQDGVQLQGGRHIDSKTVSHPSLHNGQFCGHLQDEPTPPVGHVGYVQGGQQLLGGRDIDPQAVLHPPLPASQSLGHVQGGVQLLEGHDIDPQAILHTHLPVSQPPAHVQGGAQFQEGCYIDPVPQPPLPDGQACGHLLGVLQLPGVGYKCSAASGVAIANFSR